MCACVVTSNSHVCTLLHVRRVKSHGPESGEKSCCDSPHARLEVNFETKRTSAGNRPATLATKPQSPGMITWHYRFSHVPSWCWRNKDLLWCILVWSWKTEPQKVWCANCAQLTMQGFERDCEHKSIWVGLQTKVKLDNALIPVDGVADCSHRASTDDQSGWLTHELQIWALCAIFT